MSISWSKYWLLKLLAVLGFIGFFGLSALVINSLITGYYWSLLQLPVLTILLIASYWAMTGRLDGAVEEVVKPSFGSRKNRWWKKCLFLIPALLFYPLFFFWFSLKNSQKWKVKAFLFFFDILILAPFWLGGWAIVGAVAYFEAPQILHLKEVEGVSGTGSMYPTFPKGTCKKGICPDEVVAEPLMYRYSSGYIPHRGDIVSFFNEKTKEITEKKYGEGNGSGFIKRAIGLPGDTLEIRDGFVWINGNRLNESYTAESHSTFGGSSASECQQIAIPDGKLFVMGDNRKGSGDSRSELGLIDISDINHYLPFDEQAEYEHLWRSTDNDGDMVNQPMLDVQEFISLINERRAENQKKLLSYNEKLSQSAEKRLAIMAKYDDFSSEAKTSGYTMEKAIKDAGYSNIVWGEGYSLGYYTAQELLDSYFESSNWEKFILDNQYQEIGISVKVTEVNHCPTQVIVIHMGGYVPPNYSQEDINSWKQSLSGLKKIRSGWKDWDKNSDFYDAYKSDIKRINEIISLRIGRIDKIILRMEANQWLTKEEQRWRDEDESLFNEQDKLASRINKAVDKWY